MRLRNVLLLLLIWLLGPAAAGRAAPAAGWLPDAALSQLMLRTLVQTPDGLLWVGTDDGVYRYDGTRLVSVNKLRRGGPALPAVPCELLLHLPDGQLWMGTEAGLFRFRPDGVLEALPLPVARQRSRAITALALAPGGQRVWVSQSGIGTRAYTRAGRPQGPLLAPGRRLAELWAAPDSSLWLAGEDYTEQLRPDDGRVLGRWQQPHKIPLRPVYDPQGRPWLIGGHGIYRAGAAGKLEPAYEWDGQTRPHYSPSVLRQAAGPVLMLRSQLQQLEWSPGPDPRPRLRFALPLPPWPTAGWSGQLRADRAGHWWVFDSGTRGCWRRNASPPFIHALAGPGERPYSVRAMVRLPDGRLLVSSYVEGILTQAADSPLAPLRRWPAAVLPTGNAPVLLGVVPAPLGPGGDWLAVGAYPFLRLNPHTGRFEELRAFGETQTMIGMNCLTRDSASGRVWAGTLSGLYYYDAALSTFRPYVGLAAMPPPLAGRKVEDVVPDGRGRLWLATPEGVERLTLRTGWRVAYGPTAPPARRVAVDGARCLYLAPDGRLWVGTRAHGLAVIEPDGRARSVLTLGQGLPNASVASILPGPDGALWLGTYQGLVRYQPATGQLAVYTTAHGLVSDECNAQAAYRDPADGSLLIGGVAGLHRVYPDQVPRPNPVPPRLQAAAVTVLSTTAREPGGTRYLLATDSPPHLRLGPDRPLVDVHLALANDLDPARARFAYRIRGWLNDQWLALGTTPQLRLQGLPPGSYTVEVRGESSQGLPAANRLRLPLTVTAAWWNWPLTWALGALAASAAVYGWQRNRLRRVRRETELRARLAADLHDEVGGLLTRVTMQAELLHELAPAPSARLATLVEDSRAAASTVRDIIWSVDTASDTLAALVDRIRDHLDATARATGRTLELDEAGLPQDLDQPLPPAVRQHTYLIFKEAVTNALKYSAPDTPIAVTLRLASPLELTVTNAGTAAAASRAGQGLRNMRQRADLLGAELSAGPVPGGWQVRLR